ncbi:uncharacterized protein LOC124368925 [Homalodisca vitripennis]|uniref:uncharacterized protein LOC124368925 n=1 Tax=Homalodisca vitripennis TaxID=197043 RepID=UPI001EE9F782|nr:uncharacterized protein LOC124368925 [Homalodisca vitripennis]XP_046682428.1 uncharacterized protein LOC124368925 [Homalodisca vitripennis]
MATSNFPEWLTGDFLKSCLESDKENFRGITIKNYQLEPAVAPGNNYGSYIIRANVRYKVSDDSTESSVSLILKAPLSKNSIIAEVFDDSRDEQYKNEAKYYSEFISQSYKLSKHDLVPKLYKSPNPLCVVLEDLNASGFEMIDRRKLLDFDHCKLFAEASSKLHALSIAIYKTNPDLIESFGTNKPILGEIQKVMMPNSLICMAAYLEDKPEYKKQFDIIKEASENDVFWTIFKEMLDVSTSKPIKALTQADPWCTNMMFKYNSSGRPVQIKIIDFQSAKLKSPLVEFVTFLSTSANLEVRQNRLNDLYKIYCDSLNGNLTALGCPERLSMEELEAEITFLSPIVLFHMCGLPMTLADTMLNVKEYVTVKFSLDTVKDSLFYKEVYTGTYFDINFPQIFSAYKDHGVYDYMSERIREMKSRK